MSKNLVILIGNLGRDPELKTTQSGSQVCKFSIATSEKYKDKQGVKQQKTEWHNIVVFGKQAEIAAQYLQKGRQVCIEGKITYRKWEKDGETKYMTEIVANNFTFLGEGGGGQQRAPQQQQKPPQAQSIGHSSLDDDDIPF